MILHSLSIFTVDRVDLLRFGEISYKCEGPLWVESRLRAKELRMSAFWGEADNQYDQNCSLRTSALCQKRPSNDYQSVNIVSQPDIPMVLLHLELFPPYNPNR